MKHLFIPYELALIAKEKGFNEPCFAYYSSFDNQIKFFNTDILDFGGIKFQSAHKQLALLYQQIVDWFWFKHDLVIGLDYTTDCWVVAKNRNALFEFGDLDKAIEEAFKLI